MKTMMMLAALLFAGGALADANSDAFNAGASFGKGNSSQGTSSLSNPGAVTGSIPGYTSSPAESDYYGGVTGGDSGLGDKGQQALQNSGAGQAIISSGTTNPAPVIDPDAPYITAGKSAEANSDTLVDGTGNAQQCQSTTVTKSVFDKYSCDRDVWVEQSCTRTGSIETEGSSTFQDQTLVYQLDTMPMTEVNGNNVVTIVPTISGTIIQAYYSFANYGLNQDRWNMTINVLGNSFPWKSNRAQPQTAFTPVPAKLTAGVGFTSSHTHELHEGSGRLRFSKHVPFTLRLVVRTTKSTAVPKVVWKETCGFDKTSAVSVSSVCSVAGGNRSITIDGVTQQVNSDCWEYTDQYLQKSDSEGTCGTLISDPACTVTGTQCQTTSQGYCEHEIDNYECQRNFTSGGVVCGGQYFCRTGDCSDTDGAGDSGFDTAVAKLAGLASAGDDIVNDQINVRAFTGQSMSCRKAVAGFSNCCKDSGWGADAGLAACNSDEMALGKAKAKKVTVSVGERCDHQVLGVCIQKSQVYCVFQGKLARIIQEQGRRDQLGIGFGSGDSPDCSGITVPQLQGINFDLINFADFYEDLMNNQKIPDSSVMVQQIKDRIAAQVQQQQSSGSSK